MCARGYVLCRRSGLPSDYFEGTLEKFDPAKPDKEGQVTHPPPPMSRSPPPLSDYLKGTLEKFDPPKPDKVGQLDQGS